MFSNLYVFGSKNKYREEGFVQRGSENRYFCCLLSYFRWNTVRPARVEMIFLKNSTNLIRIGQLWIWGCPWFVPPRITLGRWNMDNLSGLGLKLHFVAHGRPKRETVIKFSIILCTCWRFSVMCFPVLGQGGRGEEQRRGKEGKSLCTSCHLPIAHTWCGH